MLLRLKEAEITKTVIGPNSIQKSGLRSVFRDPVERGQIGGRYQHRLSTALRNRTPCRSKTMQKVLIT